MQVHSSLRPLSSVNGKINHVFLIYPGAISEIGQIYDRYNGIFRALPADVKYTIMARQSRRNAYKNSLRPWKAHVANAHYPLHAGSKKTERDLRLILIDSEERYLELQRWAQDCFYVLQNHSHTVLLNSMSIESRSINGSRFIAEYLAAQTDFLLKPFPFEFEGGDILIGSDFVILGQTIITKNFRQDGLHNPRDLKRNLTQLWIDQFGVKDVLWLDHESFADNFYAMCPQDQRFISAIVHHIDLYITLGDKRDDGSELVFVGEVDPEFCHPACAGMQPVTALGKLLDDLAIRLAGRLINGRKCTVRRIPLVMDYRQGANSEVILRSLNNCLVEVFDDQKNVYLPLYSSEITPHKNILDAARTKAVNVFEAEGFKTTMVDFNFMDLSNKKGALHCLVKILERK